MTLDPKLLASARPSFPSGPAAITLGAVVHGGECHPEPIVTMPIGLNRHGQILKSPVTRTVAGVVARGLMGALLGTPAGRRRSYF